MRILIIPSWYPTPAKPVNGIFIREQADALSARHEVRVLYLDVLPRGTGAKPAHLIRRDRRYVEETIEVPNLPFVWQFAYLLIMAGALLRVRRSFRPEIVHCHIAVPAGWAATMLRPLIGAPIVLTENSSEFDSWTKRPGLRWMSQWAFSHAEMVIAVSHGQMQRIRQVYHRQKNIEIVPNIVDTGRFTPSDLPEIEGGYHLLFVGLMDTNQKGVHILLEALSRIVAEDRLDLPLHLDIVGDGALRTSYEELVRRLGIEQNVIFHGLQPHDAVARMMHRYHALVLPSLHEALPLVIIEALASGRPVISTRCGGPEYMIDDSTGIIVGPGEVAPLADAIVYLLTHLEKYDARTIAATAARRYSYTAVTTALTQVFTRILSQSKRRRQLDSNS